jgi:hypothetical protein
MFRSKYLVVAAVIALAAVNVMASNFRAADQVYIPAAGKLVTGSGTFVSDVWVQNLSATEQVTVSVIYTGTGPGQTPQYRNNLFTLGAGERKEFVDFVGTAAPNGLGLSAFFGTLVFNACRQGGDCVNGTDPATGTNPNFRNIAVFSRIYSIPVGRTTTDNPPAPTVGQAFPGIPWYNYVSSKSLNAPNGSNLSRIFITGFRNTGTNQPGTYRSAIGLMNASQFSTTTLQLTLLNGSNGTTIGETSVTLDPLGHVQNNIGTFFPTFTGATATNAFVRITQVASTPTSDAAQFGCSDGCPGFLAYGSLLDNVTNDATTLESVYDAPLSSLALDVIYGSGSAGKPVINRAARRSGP